MGLANADHRELTTLAMDHAIETAETSYKSKRRRLDRVPSSNSKSALEQRLKELEDTHFLTMDMLHGIRESQEKLFELRDHGHDGVIQYRTFSEQADSPEIVIQQAAAEPEFLAILRLHDPLDKEQVERLVRGYEEGSDEVKAAAVAVLYRHAPDIYWPQLFETFTVRNFKNREESEYHFIPMAEHQAVVDKIDAALPPCDLDPTPAFLQVFLHYRERDEWVKTEKDQNLSIARFSRGIFFYEVLGEDLGLKAMNRIDAQTEAELRKE